MAQIIERWSSEVKVRVSKPMPPVTVRRVGSHRFSRIGRAL